MKIFKSQTFPTLGSFEKACLRYGEYYAKRQRGENQPYFTAAPLVLQYLAACSTAEQKGQAKPALEFIEISEQEWRRRQDKTKSDQQTEEQRHEDEEEAADQRLVDLQRAATDPDFKEQMFRAELDKGGITVAELTYALVKERHDGTRDQSFWDKRRKIQQELNDEIKQATKG